MNLFLRRSSYHTACCCRPAVAAAAATTVIVLGVDSSFNGSATVAATLSTSKAIKKIT